MDFIIAVIVFIIIWAVFASWANSNTGSGGPYGDPDNVHSVEGPDRLDYDPNDVLTHLE